MSDRRTHHVTTTDGVRIGGTVHGQGPPLVLLQGIIGDGDLDWQALLPHLSSGFTCHVPSMRGRGLSGDHPDLSLDRVVDDFLAYIDSIEGPTGVVGWSGGANQALSLAAESDAVNAVAPYEPVVISQFDEQEHAALDDAVARMAELVAEGNLAEAARALAAFPFTDADMALADSGGYFEAVGRYAPSVVSFFQQLGQYQGPTLDDPAVLGAVSAPVLVLLGSDTKPYATRSARYVADHVTDARMQEIAGAGHAAPLTHPEALARALTEFFAPAQQSA